VDFVSEEAALHPPTSGRRSSANVRVPKAAEVIADQIRRQIIRGELTQGELLPPEVELTARWGLGRPAVREALRILESEGLIRVRRGNMGGAIVQYPSVSVAARAAAIILQVENTSLQDIYEARLSIESGAAYTATERARPETIAKLLELLDEEHARIGNAQLWATAAVRFHEGIVQAAGVRTLVLFSDMLSELIDEHQHSVVLKPGLEAPSSRALASKSHAKLLSLIQAGDPERARRHWHTHLKEANARYFATD
jgi:GntR family transcriptional regulator, transcriptional repressor for pyruvate dehydrogenase complex